MSQELCTASLVDQERSLIFLIQKFPVDDQKSVPYSLYFLDGPIVHQTIIFLTKISLES